MSCLSDRDLFMKQLVDAGVHFGHKKNKWNPKMNRYIFGERGGIHIIDLSKTISQLVSSCKVLSKIVGRGGRVLFVGNKHQAKDPVKDSAELCKEFYVCERWLGGILTNFSTIRESVNKLHRMEKQIESEATTLKKKELSKLSKATAKLEKNLTGIKHMTSVPSVVIVVDPISESIAVNEARKLSIPVIAIVDTNCDPDLIDYVVAGNDDSIKSNALLLKELAQAIYDKKEEMGLMKPLSKDSDGK